MIELKGISKTYKSKKGIITEALKDINIEFENKGLVFIVGKSGSGKSTLLNLLGGLDSPDSGEILFNKKNICKFSSKELDAYRNSYVGFVFQEFNLLEEFDVRENIDIALKLQKKFNDNKIHEILKKVDLENLESRNINELSGGQKQRVSIARALIKDPKLILADEPTGNLDRKSSDQIFELLKDISKNELVIIVSHDIESANTYADRIIRIEDGEIISDSKPKIKDKIDDKISFKSSKMPNKYLLKMAYSYIMSKPFRLIMTILLTMISLSFMAFAINVYLFDNTSILVNTMEDNNNYRLNIIHREYEFNENGERKEKSLAFDDSDYDYLENLSNSKVNKEYYLSENGDSLTFYFGEITSEYEDNDAFVSVPSNFRFIEIKDNRIINNIIGNYPTESDQIVVHKYFADFMINFGIKDENNELYFPKDYNEIVNSNNRVKLSNHLVKIVGIVDDDKKLYNRAIETGNFWNEGLKRFYNDNYSSKASLIYVNQSFINDIELLNDININNIKISYLNNTSRSEVRLLETNIEYIDLDGNIKKTSSINSNDVIISINTLRNYFNDYNSNYDNYLKNNSNKKYIDLLRQYTIQYLKNNTIENINVKINDSKNEENNIEAKIIGVTLDDYDYISKDYINNYNGSMKNILSIYIYQDDKETLKNIFNNTTVLYTEDYFLPGEKYVVTYDNSTNVSGVIYAYRMLKRFLASLSIIFICFSALLILNFISVSIDSFRKEIGILRSIGTTNRDVIKLFGCETFLIAFISWIFGMIVWLIECKILNNYLFDNLYFTLNGIVIKPIVVFIVLIFNIFVSFIITSILINKINKVKPIEVILNK